MELLNDGNEPIGTGTPMDGKQPPPLPTVEVLPSATVMPYPTQAQDLPTPESVALTHPTVVVSAFFLDDNLDWVMGRACP